MNLFHQLLFLTVIITKPRRHEITQEKRKKEAAKQSEKRSTLGVFSKQQSQWSGSA